MHVGCLIEKQTLDRKTKRAANHIGYHDVMVCQKHSEV